MEVAEIQRIRLALERSWSERTSFCFLPTAPPSYGQCAQTAIIVQEYCGGEILRTTGWHGEGKHFYNRIGGVRLDFTEDQFTGPEYSYELKYEDQLSSADEAMTETSITQVEELRTAFLREVQNAT